MRKLVYAYRTYFVKSYGYIVRRLIREHLIDEEIEAFAALYIKLYLIFDQSESS